MRIGLIGASRIAREAIIDPARANPLISVSAVAARDPERARAFARLHAIPNIYPDYETLIRAPGIDMIYIATPPATHAELALRSIAAGKPVLVEKPFTVTAAEARSVYDAARSNRVPVFEAMHSLHHTLFRRLTDIVAMPQLGRIVALRADFSTPIRRDPSDFRWSPELGGGALLDLGVYPLAWCRQLAGEDFRVAVARADWQDGIDARFDAQMAFAGGIRAEISASMLAARHDAFLEISFENGAVRVENPLVPHTGNRITVSCGGDRTDESVAGPSTYEAQLTAVERALSGRAEFPLPLDDYVHSMAAIDRVRAAFTAV